MDYRELLSRLAKQYDAGEARAVLRLLLEKDFCLSWTEVLCGAVGNLPAEQQKRLEQSVLQLEKGIPVQYVLGEAEFFGRDFHVEEGVLIPRPETEELVSQAISSVRQLPNPADILDIGTGSGCIAISLALEDRNWNIHAWDVSEKALDIAKKNAERLEAGNISFREVDILAKTLPADDEYSLIVSNPPYICEREKAQMEHHVLDYEPALALFVPDEEPLLFYSAITDFAKKTVRKNGFLLFEINREYGREVADLLLANGFASVEIIKDQFGNDRIVKGQK